MSAFHVHNVDLLVERLKVFLVFLLLVQVFVQDVDEREVNCLSTVVLIDAAWYEPLFFDDCFVLCATDMVEFQFLRTA